MKLLIRIGNGLKITASDPLGILLLIAFAAYFIFLCLVCGCSSGRPQGPSAPPVPAAKSSPTTFHPRVVPPLPPLPSAPELQSAAVSISPDASVIRQAVPAQPKPFSLAADFAPTKMTNLTAFIDARTNLSTGTWLRQSAHYPTNGGTLMVPWTDMPVFFRAGFTIP